jgi:hypothetical protein
MLMTNIILVLAVVIMIAIAIWLFSSTEGGVSNSKRRQQVRIADRDTDRD